MTEKIKVFCTFRQVGFHNWPNAPEEHKYLAQLHRHEFHVRVEVEVVHADRAIEFIKLKQIAKTAFQQLGWQQQSLAGMINFGSRSCEVLAKHLRLHLLDAYPLDDIPKITAIEVSEDGENGARVEFE